MNKNDILSILNKYHLPKEQFIILSGAALTLLNIKEDARDIDIAVTYELYNYLLEKYNCVFEKVNPMGNKVYFIDSIINFGTDYMDVDYEMVENYQVQTPTSIKQLKLMLNRQKDKNDIELIEKWEKKHE